MNNRIMVLLLVLLAVLFVSDAPVEANAAAAPHEHADSNGNCVCDYDGCTESMHVANQNWTSDENGHYQWCYRNDGTKMLEAAHTYGAFVNQGAQQHWRDCTVCSYTDKQDHSDATNDCICDGCGVELEHELETVNGFAATCEKDGLHTHSKCNNCGVRIHVVEGRVLSPNEEIIKALGHVENGQWSFDKNQHYQWCWRDCGTKLVSANHTFRYVNQGRDMHDVICDTCGYNERVPHAEGTIKDCKCDDCGADLEHTRKFVIGMAATCLVDGYEPYEYCTNCGKTFDYEVIKARGYHVMGSHVYQDIREGDHYTACNDCNYKAREPHTMVVSNPLKGNYHQWMCKCGKLETETHYDKNGDKKCDVCGHSMGGSSVKVEQHDNVTIKTGQKETVNNNKSWMQNWMDSLNANNKDTNKSASSSSSASSSTGSSSTGSTGSGSTGSSSTGSTGSGSTGSSSTGSTGSGSTGGTSTGDSVAPSGTNTPSTSTSVSTPVAEQTSVVMQFINWFLGLFRF